jgi:8-hydroxy-5-deazaflavin:NADPH oxidoreductase
MTDNRESTLVTIGIIGGTGHEGSGLAMRWANSGYRVVIGSRDVAKAQTVADDINTKMGFSFLTGMDNLSAAREASIVVLTVPYAYHRETLEGLREALVGKILIDVTVPLAPPDIRRVNVPEGKSACMEAQALLGSDTRVVAAFQNVSAHLLQDLEKEVNCDVLVCGDDADAKHEVIQLCEAADMRGLDAGPLANAVAVEALTPVLLYMNKRYKSKGSGIVITNLPETQ